MLFLWSGWDVWCQRHGDVCKIMAGILTGSFLPWLTLLGLGRLLWSGWPWRWTRRVVSWNWAHTPPRFHAFERSPLIATCRPSTQSSVPASGILHQSRSRPGPRRKQLYRVFRDGNLGGLDLPLTLSGIVKLSLSFKCKILARTISHIRFFSREGTDLAVIDCPRTFSVAYMSTNPQRLSVNGPI